MLRIKQLDEELQKQTELNRNIMKQMRKMEFQILKQKKRGIESAVPSSGHKTDQNNSHGSGATLNTNSNGLPQHSISSGHLLQQPAIRGVSDPRKQDLQNKRKSHQRVNSDGISLNQTNMLSNGLKQPPVNQQPHKRGMSDNQTTTKMMLEEGEGMPDEDYYNEDTNNTQIIHDDSMEVPAQKVANHH